MKKILLSSVLFLAAFVISGCSDSESNVPDSLEKVNAQLVGVWYCTYQQWTEDGETWSEEYEPSSMYSMFFYENGTGYMDSGYDELFEIGGGHKFEWKTYKSNSSTWLHTDVYEGQKYKINSLTSRNLVMTWTDEDYSIVCQFVKYEGDDF